MESASEPLIRIERLGVGFESARVFGDISFDIPATGLMAIMGPGGVGKTTLLRTLGRWNESLPSFWQEGRILLEGRDLLEMPAHEAQASVPLLVQKARLFTATVGDNAIAELRGSEPLTVQEKRDLAHGALEPHGLWEEFEPLLAEPVHMLSIGRQRMLSIARLTAVRPRCLLLDEPLRDILREDAEMLEAMIRRLARRLSVVMVTHNQREAREMSEKVCLITAGRLVETTPTERFFSEPSSELGREFLRNGNCWPAAEPGDAEVNEEAASSPQAGFPPPPIRPSGFHWIVRGRLGGTQWPGLLSDEQRDLEALRSLGAEILVSLTETCFDTEKLEPLGIRGEHFPIVDMGAPDFEAARDLCDRISSWMDANKTVILHCKAGLGRTGTMLACTLVARGADAVSAVHKVRCTNPLYIQSGEQLAFVAAFAARLKQERGVPV